MLVTFASPLSIPYSFLSQVIGLAAGQTAGQTKEPKWCSGAP